jgi:hypothetical protein
VVDNYEASGTLISAPKFIQYNATWQFDMTIVAETGSAIIPLFSNRTFQNLTAQVSKRAEINTCTGFVETCCLYALSEYYINTELTAYTNHLGPCEGNVRTRPTTETLKGIADERIFAVMAFPRVYERYPRVWGTGQHTYTVEILTETLKEPWLTRDMGTEQATVNSDVVDRELIVSFVYLNPTPTSRVQMITTHHSIIFADATKDIGLNSNSRHQAFHHTCSDSQKPPNSLWRADVMTGDVVAGQSIENNTCLWFCLPGYHLYPSATDFYHIHIVPQDLESAKCEPVPTTGAQVMLELTVNITIDLTPFIEQPNIDPSTGEFVLDTFYIEQLFLEIDPYFFDTFIAFSMVGIQVSIADACSVPGRHSTFYLQSTQNYTTNPPGEYRPEHRQVLEISAVLYTSDITNNASTQMQFILNQISSVNTTLAVTEAIRMYLSTSFSNDPDDIDLITSTLTIHAIDVLMRYPQILEIFPFKDYAVLSAWAACMLFLLGTGCMLAYRRMGRRRFRRRYNALAALLQSDV